VTADSSSVSPPSGKPLVRFAALQRVVCVGPAGVLVPCSRLALAVSRVADGFSPGAVPRDLHHGFIRSSFAPLQRLRLSPAPSLSTRSGLPWGCVPSSRHQPAASLQPSSHSVTASPASFLTTSTTFAAGLRGFVSPRSHVQGSPFRGSFLRHSLSRLVVDPCPLVGWLPSPAAVARSASSSRPALRAFFRGGVRGVDVGVTQRRRSIPSWVSLLQVLRLRVVGTPSRSFRSWPCKRRLPKHPTLWPSACFRLGARPISFETCRPARGLLPAGLLRRGRPLLPAVHFDRRPSDVRVTLQRLYQPRFRSCCESVSMISAI
jgi:hypothetical protein